MSITTLCREKINKYDDTNARYRLLNQILYDMVRDYPLHTNEHEITAKLWIIGRTYAAAVERRNNKAKTPGDFYYNYVVPAMMKVDKEGRNSNILDSKINNLRAYTEITEKNLPELLSVHKYLMDLFHVQTEKDKRSLASKYLHFHLPNLFIIYDSRVASVISNLTTRLPKSFAVPNDSDQTYARFCYKAISIYNVIKNTTYSDCTIRVLDNILLRYCDEKGIENIEE